MRILPRAAGTALLAAFASAQKPDLAALLDQVASGDRRLATLQQLAALGRSAHEALLGLLVPSEQNDSIGPRLRASSPSGQPWDRFDLTGGNFATVDLAPAFGDFDAGAAWSLPILVAALERPPTRECAITLLERLGNAAWPAEPALRRLLEQLRQHDRIARLLQRLDDVPHETPPAPPRATAVPDGERQQQLLGDLLEGSAESRFPALQGLVELGDVAAFEGLVVLLQQVHENGQRRRVCELLRWLRCTYRARGALDSSSALALPAARQATEYLRYVLAFARTSDPLDHERVLQLDAQFRPWLAARLVLEAIDGAPSWQGSRALERLAAEKDPELRALVALARPALDPEVRALLLDCARAAARGEQRANGPLAAWSLDEFDAGSAPTLLSLMESREVSGFAMHSIANAVTADIAHLDQLLAAAQPAQKQKVLLSLCGGRLCSPAVLERLVDLVASGHEIHEIRAMPVAAAASLLALATTPARRLAVLRVVDQQCIYRDWTVAVLPLLPRLQEQSPELTSEERALLLGIVQRSGADGLAQQFAACRTGPVEERRKAVTQLAYAKDPPPAQIAFMRELLDDADDAIALRAVSGLRAAPEHHAAAVARLRQIWEQASDPKLQRSLCWAASELGPSAAPLLPRMTALFGSADPLERAGTFRDVLLVAPGHAEATAGLRAMLRSTDAHECERAWCVIRLSGSIVDQFRPELLLALESKDQFIRYWGMRALQNMPHLWPRWRQLIESLALANTDVQRDAVEILEKLRAEGK